MINKNILKDKKYKINMNEFDKNNIYKAILNLIPFWSSNIIKFFNLGNEYNLLFTIVMTEFINYTNNFFNDLYLIFTFLIIFIILLMYKFNFKLNSSYFNIKSITIQGSEIISKDEQNLLYCNKILAINYYLITKFNIDNITYINNYEYLINNIYNFNIYKNIYLDISRNKIDNFIIVKYKIWSYSNHLIEFINEMETFYQNNKFNEITIIGKEQNKIFIYSEPIYAINYKLSLNNQFKNLIYSFNLKNYELNNEKINEVKSLDYTFSFENLINYEIDKNIFLTIYKNRNNIFYYIKSKEHNCKEWLEKLIIEYKQKKLKKFNYNLRLNGREELWYKNNGYKKYFYSKEMWSINWYIIEKLKYQNIECITEEDTLYKYALEPINLLEIENDFYITIKKKIFTEEEIKENNNNIDTNVIYTLYSNNLNLSQKLNTIIKEFELYKKMNQNQILYHFIYNGIKNDQLIFTTKILLDKNSNIELYETFETIFHEHIEMFKNDLDKLKDLNYYKKYGSKRKKGYLFYGESGCGKTSTVLAMALYDKRHIIEIPISLITTHEEFNKLINLNTINGIEFNSDQIILLFDEIDFGIENYSSMIINNDEKKIQNIIIDSSNKDSKLNTYNQKLNLGTILSKFDGIGNYNGLVLIGTTNNIQKLDKSLYRELRLTPIFFDKLRKIDCLNIINLYFDFDLNHSELNNILKDRFIYASKLIYYCQNWHHLTKNDFLAKLKILFSL
jgi:hypothetical protein